MDVKYQVFVSSTYVDLVEERRKVTEAILNLGHIPVGMEAFHASDSSQWEYIQRRIDESDYYVVIVGERYGSETRGKSYTQLEYEYAVKKGVPVAAFLIGDDARKKLPVNLVEFDKKAKIEKFRALCKKKLIKHWENSDDLAYRVSQTLSEMMSKTPRVGWVRANQVPSSHVLNELAALSEEKRAMQTRIAALSENGTLKIPDTALYRINRLRDVTISKLMDYESLDGEFTLLDMFDECVQPLLDGTNAIEITQILEDVNNAHYDDSTAEAFLRELMSNNLVSSDDFHTAHQDRILTKRYQLSDYGKEFLMFRREWDSRQIGTTEDKA